MVLRFAILFAAIASSLLVPGAQSAALGASWWEYAPAQYAQGQSARADRARIDEIQPSLLQADLARLAPRAPGATNVYAIGVAGYADQDVFIREVDGGLASLAAVLPIKDRAVRLINHRATEESVAAASRANLAAAIRGVGSAMDKNEDVLVLFMTSHGTRKSFVLQFPGRNDELTPRELAALLDGEKIRNRVVIISACYSGIFVKPLVNANTIVLTAADARNTSFGCSTEREWTYFGDALFAQSLRPGLDFKAAFDRARFLIDGWEAMDRAPPSHPQGHFGAALVKKLEPVLNSMSRAQQ